MLIVAVTESYEVVSGFFPSLLQDLEKVPQVFLFGKMSIVSICLALARKLSKMLLDIL